MPGGGCDSKVRYFVLITVGLCQGSSLKFSRLMVRGFYNEERKVKLRKIDLLHEVIAH